MSADVPPPPIEPQNAPTHNVRDERMWAMFCHLSTFAVYVTGFGHILGPLIIWLIKKDEYPLVDDQGKEALNFQISMTIYALVCIAMAFTIVLIPVTFVGLIGLTIFDVIITIIAAIAANEGDAYRYPLCIRFIS